MLKIAKILIGIILFALFIYFLVSIQIKQEVSVDMLRPDFMMEMSEFKLRGWDKENIDWEMTAKRAYHNDKNSLVLINVYDGFFLDGRGDTIIESLELATVNANILKKSFVLEGVTFNIKTQSADKMLLNAEILYYEDAGFKSDNKYFLKTNTWEITSKKLKIDTNYEIIDFAKDVVLKNEHNVLRSDGARYSLKENSLLLTENVIVRYVYFQKEEKYEVDIFSEEIIVVIDKDNHVADFRKGMTLQLEKDVLSASYGSFDSKKSFLRLVDAEIRIEDGTRVLNNFEGQDVKGSIITAREMTIDFNNKDVQLEGDVNYLKDKRKISAGKGAYDVDAGILRMRGRTEIVEGNKIIRSDDVVIDVRNDLIKAQGNVKTRLKI